MSSEKTDKTEPTKFWAVVELMGHRKLAGEVSEAVIAGAHMLRIDVPKPPPAITGSTTQFYSASAIYAISPVTEEIARAASRSYQPAPINRWEIPEMHRALPSGSTVDASDHDGDLDDPEPEPL
jgi:hypothetical protein